MNIRQLRLAGMWEVTPRVFGDDRGAFLEWFKSDAFERASGHRFDPLQSNCSVSAAGVIRGIHFAEVPPGQAKYVTCLSGAVLDVGVDIRLGSPTFGQWDAVVLDDVNRKAVYLPEGMGHAFMSLEDRSVFAYLCSQPYAPEREHGIDPLDPAVGIDWPTTDRHGMPVSIRLSASDSAAPSLVNAKRLGLLPTMTQCQNYIESMH